MMPLLPASQGGRNRLSSALALLSSAVIGIQLAVMQLLSFLQWHHFAFMIISVALLGFGLSGTVLALSRGWFVRKADILLPVLTLACAAATTSIPWILQSAPVRFDSYRVFVETSHAIALVLTYLVLLLPFLSGALAIGLAFIREPRQIGALYFWNLFGSASGTILVLFLMHPFVPEKILPLLGLMPLIAGVLVAHPVNRRGVAVWAVVVGAGCTFCFLYPPQIVPSEYKGLSRALSLPDAEVLLERPGPQGILHAVRAPALRYAPGVSLRYTGPVPGGMALFVNGESVGPLLHTLDLHAAGILDHTTLAAAYEVRPPGRVLVLQAGTGMLAAHALARGARRVTAVEPHSGIVDLMTHELAEETDSLYFHPSVTVVNADPRSFLLIDTTRYDLIVLPTIDAFGGTLGVYAMQEQYGLTREAFGAMFRRLTPGGIISVSSWLDEPPRNTLRLLATLAEVVDSETTGPPGEHIMSLRSWGMITYLLFRSPVGGKEEKSIRAFADRMDFDPALLPGITAEERTRHNSISDTSFFTSLDRILSADRVSLYKEYDFDIAPALDDRPYFSQFLRGASLRRIFGVFGARSFPFLELGYCIVLVTVVQIFVAALILVLLPVFRGCVKGPGRGWTLVYFFGIGLGFICVEIAFIQKCVLFLGHPVYAAAAAMGGLLLGAGAGSALSSRIRGGRRPLAMSTTAVAGVIGVAYLALVPLLSHTAAASSALGFVVSFLAMAVVAVPMGFPFPLGLRSLAVTNEVLLPWAWGVNGSASVLGTAIATFVGVTAGFSVVLLLAIGAYLIAAGASVWSGQKHFPLSMIHG